jgi:hypothetical protein
MLQWSGTSSLPPSSLQAAGDRQCKVGRCRSPSPPMHRSHFRCEASGASAHCHTPPPHTAQHTTPQLPGFSSSNMQQEYRDRDSLGPRRGTQPSKAVSLKEGQNHLFHSHRQCSSLHSREEYVRNSNVILHPPQLQSVCSSSTRISDNGG